MDAQGLLYGFMDMACEDPRIGPSHISLYMAILHASLQQGGAMPVSVFSRGLMKQAKIGGVATYHKCLQDLTEAGYIRYTPSFHPMKGSSIYI